MNKKVALFLGSLMCLLLAGCATMRVAVNYDETVDFGSYRSFYFVKPQPRQAMGPGRRAVQNPLFTKDVMQEIMPMMESKGFSEAAVRGEADLLVVFYAAVKNRREWAAPTYRVGRWGRVWRTSPGHFVNYKEGTLVIDMVDARRKELVWQGVGTGVLDRANPQANLAESVRDILDDFPPIQE